MSAAAAVPPWLLHQPFERAALKYSDCAAVRDGQGERWSYAQVHAAGLSRARALLAAGLPMGARVGVWMRKAPATVAALWGVLRAGGVYVPLDPLAPSARIAALAADAQLWGLIADAEHAAAARQWPQPPAWIADDLPTPSSEMDDLPQPPRTGDDLAYILYTSGSTGVPKGVMLSHQHALNFIQWAAAEVALEASDRVASHAPFHFDLSIFDLWATLSRGAEVCLLDPVTARFPNAVAAWIRTQGISVWYSVPSALVAMVPQLPALAVAPSTLRSVIFAGEVFPAPALAAWRQALPQAAFHNWYGPTETNVCTYYRLPAGVPPDPLPIGRACPNFELALLDDDLQPVVAGATGDLWARGPGLLTGYWGDAARSAAVCAQRTPAAGGPGQRWYNTGDRAHYGPDGELYFQGRRDSLIKCRGYRISLLEVEQALETCPGVAQAAVLATPDAAHATGLRAFIRPAGAAPAVAAVRAWLSQRLPAYMLPDEIEVYAELPTTSTGKIDRQRLPRATTA